MNTPTITVTEAVNHILNTTADELDKHATTTHPLSGTTQPVCMSEGLLSVTTWTTVGVIDRVPDARLRHKARIAFHAMLPPVAGTVAEYATQLRALAT